MVAVLTSLRTHHVCVLCVTWECVKLKCKQKKPDESYTLLPNLCSHIPTRNYFNRKISCFYLE